MRQMDSPKNIRSSLTLSGNESIKTVVTIVIDIPFKNIRSISLKKALKIYFLFSKAVNKYSDTDSQIT